MPTNLVRDIDARLARLKLRRSGVVQGDAFAAAMAGAHEAATSQWNDRRQPTPAMLNAGCYKVGPVQWQGLRLHIENPAHTQREGVSPGGQRWCNTMQAHYGYFAGTRGADGDGVDVFLGPYPESRDVWVLNQVNDDGGFDEHKVLAGFVDARAAVDAYRLSYSPGWDRYGPPIRLSVEQLKWWLKWADKSRPLTADIVPPEPETMTDTTAPTALTRVLWDSAAMPVGRTLAEVLYKVRVHDAAEGLLMDPMTMAELLDGAEVCRMDSLVIQAGRLKPKMDALLRIMEAVGGESKPLALQLSEPVRRFGGVHVAAIFEFDDGQTVTVWFHNPDSTPTRITPADDLVSWKWLLNKKDVTIVVAPESGLDLSLREVARRIVRLVGKNSAAFARANAKRAATMAEIEALRGTLAERRAALADLHLRIAEARGQAAAREAAAEQAARDAGVLPDGWTEASPGGLATNRDPVNGGIIDRTSISGKWFIVPNDPDVAKYLKEGEVFDTRREAFADLADALIARNDALEVRAKREAVQRSVPTRGTPAELAFLAALRDAGYAQDGGLATKTVGSDTVSIDLSDDGLTIVLKRGAISMDLPYDTGRTVDENVKHADALVWQLKAEPMVPPVPEVQPGLAPAEPAPAAVESAEAAADDPIEVDGGLLGSFDDTPEGKRAMRAQADAAYRALSPTLPCPALHSEVQLRTAGRRKMLAMSGDTRKLKLIPALPAIFSGAKKVATLAPYNAAVDTAAIAYHILRAPVRLDGVDLAVRVVVKEDAAGKFHYDQTVHPMNAGRDGQAFDSTKENSPDEGLLPGSTSNGEGSEPSRIARTERTTIFDDAGSPVKVGDVLNLFIEGEAAEPVTDDPDAATEASSNEQDAQPGAGAEATPAAEAAPAGGDQGGAGEAGAGGSESDPAGAGPAGLEAPGVTEATVVQPAITAVASEPDHASQQRADDLAMLAQVGAGVHPQMLEPELAELIEAALTRWPGDAEVEAAAERAVNAYSNGLLQATAVI